MSNEVYFISGCRIAKIGFIHIVSSFLKFLNAYRYQILAVFIKKKREKVNHTKFYYGKNIGIIVEEVFRLIGRDVLSGFGERIVRVERDVLKTVSRYCRAV